MWGYFALLIISTLIVSAFAPKTPKPKAAVLADFDVPTADQGRPIPVIFGTCLVEDPNVVWYGDLDTSAIKKKAG